MDIKNPTDQCRPVFNELFQFKIGDTVSMRYLVDKWKIEAEHNPSLSSYNRLASPLLFTVLERRLQECHGGIQMFYLVGGPQDGNLNAVEFELVPLSEVEDVLKNFRSKEDADK